MRFIVHDTEKDILSPLSWHGKMINIDGLNYPTIQHYVIAYLLRKQTSIGDAHLYLLVDPKNSETDPSNYKSVHELQNDLDMLRARHYNEQLVSGMKQANDIKFRNKEFRKLLRSTGDKKLVYGNPNTVLGVDKKGNGLNNTGQYLETIRQNLPTGSIVKFIALDNSNQYVENSRARLAMEDMSALFCSITKNIIRDSVVDGYTMSIIMSSLVKMSIKDRAIFQGSMLFQNPPKAFATSIKLCLGDGINITKPALNLLWRYISWIHYRGVKSVKKITQEQILDEVLSLIYILRKLGIKKLGEPDIETINNILTGEDETKLDTSEVDEVRLRDALLPSVDNNTELANALVHIITEIDRNSDRITSLLNVDYAT